MQPTLYGIVCEDLRGQPDLRIPAAWQRVLEALWSGTSYRHVVAQTDGQLEEIEPVQHILPFLKKQRFKVGGKWHTVWSPVENLSPRQRAVNPQQVFLLDYARVERGHVYRKGDDLIKVRIRQGDHLFVDRFTYNFRRPKRAEILVFETKGISSPITRLPATPQDQFYIKRMVAMNGERVQIGGDRHLRINGRRLDHNDPHFENVYSFDPKQPPKPNSYSGHANGTVARQFNREGLAPLLPDPATVLTVRPKHYLVMGDNTLDSYDGRAWGDFSRTNVIGQFFFVYWPFSSRFGWAPR